MEEKWQKWFHNGNREEIGLLYIKFTVCWAYKNVSKTVIIKVGVQTISECMWKKHKFKF